MAHQSSSLTVSVLCAPAPCDGLSKLVMLLQDGGCQYNTCQLSNVWVTWKEQRHLWGGQVTICVWTGAGLGRQHRRWLSSVSLTAAAAPLNLSRDIISAERCTQYICFGGLKPKNRNTIPYTSWIVIGTATLTKLKWTLKCLRKKWKCCCMSPVLGW